MVRVGCIVAVAARPIPADYRVNENPACLLRELVALYPKAPRLYPSYVHYRAFEHALPGRARNGLDNGPDDFRNSVNDIIYERVHVADEPVDVQNRAAAPVIVLRRRFLRVPPRIAIKCRRVVGTIARILVQVFRRRPRIHVPVALVHVRRRNQSVQVFRVLVRVAVRIKSAQIHPDDS